MALKRPENLRSQEEIYWDNLVEEIWKGNVIPVIGDSLTIEGTTISNEIIKYLAEEKNIKTNPQTFSELYYDNDYKAHQASIYEEVSALIEANQSEFTISDILRDFLSIEQFPFVITTSFDYTIEEAMRDIWGRRKRKVKSLVYNNIPTEIEDIKADSEVKEPTVYYMFGKANNHREHSFVLTDEDMLSFCKSWLSGNQPENLSRIIAEKYLLFIGVNYPDWLIRFVWYGMRSNLKNSGMLIDNREIENTLLNFFQRVSIRIKENPQDVYNEIKKRLDKKKEEYEKKKFDNVMQNTDFFISYSRRDAKWAEKLYNGLTLRGYNVWYDKKNIACGKEWEGAIFQGIRTARRFIALLSDNVANESYEHHVYRSEWDVALAHRLITPDFVKPICVGSSDILKNPDMKIPVEMQYLHAPEWKNLDDIQEIIDSIINS